MGLIVMIMSMPMTVAVAVLVSVMAVMLINNAERPSNVSFEWMSVPGLAGARACSLFDVWARQSLGPYEGSTYMARALPAHDSVLLTLSDCIF